MTNQSLAAAGRDKINWVQGYMPLLNHIKEEFERTQPFAGLRIATSIHLEAKTAYLAQVLKAGGAEVHVTGCNPLSTQDDVAEALRAEGFDVHAKHGVSNQEYEQHLLDTLACHPHLMIDDGGDFTLLLHGPHAEYADCLIGGCEETTTGIHRLKARQVAGQLHFPMINVNDANCKHLFDNRYGTGQSTLTAIMAVTNLIIASKNVVIAGYGWCGRGCAMRAQGMGAHVIVTEIDPIKALEASMDGFTVMPMDEAAAIGDLFITLTGCKDVITRRHLEKMKNGAILSNSGHFDVEINKEDLEAMAVRVWQRKPDIMGYELPDGRILNLLAEGRLVNLAAGMGHPAEIMDMSFAIQAKSLEYLAQNGSKLDRQVYAVPSDIDNAVARLKLASSGMTIDKLSTEQEAYLAGFTAE